MINDANRMLEQATAMHRSGKKGEARELYKKLLEMTAGIPEVLYRLGLISQEEGRLDEAASYFERAIQSDPNQPFFYYSVGLISLDKGEPRQAEKFFRRALDLNPNFVQVHNQLGLIAQGELRFDEAVQYFQAAIRANPTYARAHNNLGNLLRVQGHLTDAIGCFREALRLNPQYLLALVNLAGALMERGELGETEQLYARAITLNPHDPQNYSLLGRLLIVQWRLEEAEQAFRRALELDQGRETDWIFLGYVLRDQGKMDAAVEACQRVLTMNPNNMQALLGVKLALPPIYRDHAHLMESRLHFSEGLEYVLAEAARFKQQSLPISLVDLNWGNFFLAYQGQNDRELQARYSSFLVSALSEILPEFLQPIPISATACERRLKIGFVSSFFRDCTVGAYFKAWITRLDARHFEIFVYNTGYQYDDVSKEIRQGASCYAQLNGKNLREIAQRIKEDGLDVLVYPEVGMDLTLCTLSALRLAPVQCAGWGHPTTTGHQNIDYYLSCAAMEPENALEHYSEQLVLLSGIGTYYKKPPLPPAVNRQHFSLPAERNLYLCPQSLYKIHPDNDDMLLDILEQDQKATLVFFQGMFTAVTQAFMARLERGLKARQLPISKRVIFLPRLDHDAYLQVNRLCDVMLDTVHWSGGNTSLDALACMLPMVTLPGDLMRGRQSYAMLKMLGLGELVAQDRKDYVAIALRLATDASWRKTIQQRIEQNLDQVFENICPVQELEEFLLSRFESPTE